MKKLSKEVKTGIVVVIAICFFIWGFNFLKGKNIFILERQLYAVYDRVDGIVEANPVLLNGYKVGQVSKISLHPSKPGKLVVEFVITKSDLNLPKNSVATIFSVSLLGDKGMYLTLGDDKAMAQDGDTLIAANEKSMTESIAPLKDKMESMVASMDSVLISVNKVLSDENRNNINKSLASIKNVLGTIEGEKVRLHNMLANVESITLNLKNNNEKINLLMNNLASISDSIAKADVASTISNATKTLHTTSLIMEKINKGEGTMGMLIHNDSLYNGLNASAKNLDRLLEDLREHPKRYVHFSLFGKKDK